MKTVQVLLSSYNGEKYILQQLGSIFKQKGVDVFCLVRDDGSKDNTLNILLDCKKVYKNLEVIVGENIGYGASFLELIKLSGDFDFYSFSDQDDVWEPLKLIAAVEHIKKMENVPTMYFSNLTIVDNELNKIGVLHNIGNPIPDDKLTALVQGFTHGCTMVFNKNSRNLVNSYKPLQSYAHDFWIPLIHFFVGKIIYDKNSFINYRQHDNNVFGQKRSLLRLLMLKLTFFSEKKNYYSLLAKDLILGFKNILNTEDYQNLKDISEYSNTFSGKLKLLFNRKIKRNTFKGTIILKFLILFSKF
ncbi:MAG: glycosyltransferase [Salinivirgaceae bacterium]|nr:glycosyltransferase [Salinivirgaceae bacterium]